MTGVFLRVLNLSITASYIILAVLVMRLMLRRAPRWISCALWALVAVRLACPVSLESVFSLIPSAETVNPTAITETAEIPAQPIIQSGFTVIDRQANNVLAAVAVPVGQPVSADMEGTPSAPARTFRLASMVSAAGYLWLFGMAAMALYGLVSFLMLRRKVATAVRWQDNLWQSDAIGAPFVLGLIRPRIYLPFHLEDETAGHVIAHEQAHIRRRDPWWKLLGYILLAVYWFNPLSWAAYALLCKDIELACDEHVVRALSPVSRQQYALALLNCGVNRPAIAACPLAFGEVGVKERIKRVMKYKKPALWVMILAVILCAAASVCLLTNPVAEAVQLDEIPKVSERLDSHIDSVTTTDDGAVTYNVTLSVPNYENTVTTADGAATYHITLPVPTVPEEPVPILQVRPRAITAEEARTFVEGFFGDETVYEFSADDEADPVPCAWQFHPETYYYPDVPDANGHEHIEAVSQLDGVPYRITVCNKEATSGANYRIHNIFLHMDDGATNFNDKVEFTPEEITAALAKSQELLQAMGLGNYAITSCYEDAYNRGLTVIAAPVYEDVPMAYFQSGSAIDFDVAETYGGSNIDPEAVRFEFTIPGNPRSVEWNTPQDVVDTQQTETMISFNEAAELLSEYLASQEWSGIGLYTYGDIEVNMDTFGYVRMPIGDGTGDFQLVPAYYFQGGRNMVIFDAQGTAYYHFDPLPIAVISAVDGSLLAAMGTYFAMPYYVDMEPSVTRIGVYSDDDQTRDFIASPENGFAEQRGDVFRMRADWYPEEIEATPEWYTETDGVVELAPEGEYCTITLVGDVGSETWVHVRVKDVDARFGVYING